MDTPPPSGPAKPGFSQQFDTAMLLTRLIDTFMQADGWSLAEFEAAPPWLKQVYNRHAVAALAEIRKIGAGDNSPKSPERD